MNAFVSRPIVVLLHLAAVESISQTGHGVSAGVDASGRLTFEQAPEATAQSGAQPPVVRREEPDVNVEAAKTGTAAAQPDGQLRWPWRWLSSTQSAGADNNTAGNNDTLGAPEHVVSANAATEADAPPSRKARSDEEILAAEREKAFDRLLKSVENAGIHDGEAAQTPTEKPPVANATKKPNATNATKANATNATANGTNSSESATKAKCPAEDLDPPESSRTYSSTFQNQTAGGPRARSMLNSTSAWAAGNKSAGEWMQIDLGKETEIKGTVVKGQDTAQKEWVTSYKVMVSEDGKKFVPAPGAATFEGNSDAKTMVRNDFSMPVVARYVRFVVESWHNHPAMRAGVLVCKKEDNAANATNDTSGPPKECPGATLNPPEWWRKYSSVMAHEEDDKDYYRYSKLHTTKGAGAWSPAEDKGGEWMQLYLHKAFWIKGIATQGRTDMGQWVDTVRVAYSLDGKHWKDTKVDIKLNKDDVGKATHTFKEPFKARFVRIFPKHWHNKISMRAAVIGCQGYHFEKVVKEWKEFAKELRQFGHHMGMHGRKKALGGDDLNISKALSSGQTPIDCVWGEWDMWTDCTTSCGSYGVQRRERQILTYPQNGGKNCDGGNKGQQECNRNPCPFSTTERPEIIVVEKTSPPTPAPLPPPPPPPVEHEEETKVVVVPMPAAPQAAAAPIVVKEEAPPPPPAPAPPATPIIVAPPAQSAPQIVQMPPMHEPEPPHEEVHEVVHEHEPEEPVEEPHEEHHETTADPIEHEPGDDCDKVSHALCVRRRRTIALAQKP